MVKHDRFMDYLLRFFSFVGNSLPNFFVALLLMQALAIHWKLLPVISDGITIKSALMPTLTLAIAMSAKYMRQVRATVLEELDKDYVTGAKARGVRNHVILWRSVLKSSIAFTAEELERYSRRYDQIVATGREQNRLTTGRTARKEEKTLLNRLEKYKDNHLLFLHDFQIHYSNNMSEKDLRICKNRQKMAGSFRTAPGRQMYCRIMSVIGTVKRRGLNIFRSISLIIDGTPVIL